MISLAICSARTEEKYATEYYSVYLKEFLRKLMNNMKHPRTVIFLIAFLCANTLYAQKAEQQLFELLCRNIEQQHDHFLIRSKLTGIDVMEDPVSGTTSIRYVASVDKSTKAEFKKYDSSEQIAILFTDSLFSSLQDTVDLIDTIQFFSWGNEFIDNKRFFSTSRETTKKQNTSTFYLRGVYIREDDLCLCFTKGKYLVNFYFNAALKNLEIKRVSVLKNEHVGE